MIYVFFILFALLCLAASEPASITRSPTYASQRPCAQDCFALGGYYDGPWRVASAIGCAYTYPQNDCFCRPDLQANADNFLVNCVNKGCGQNTLDTNSAVSIYDAYCTNAGFLRSTPTTTGTDDFPSTVTVTVTATVKVSSAQRGVVSPLRVLVASLTSLRRRLGRS